MHTHTGLNGGTQYTVYVTSETNITSQIMNEEQLLLLRGMSEIVSTQSTTDSGAVIGAVVGVVLVIVIFVLVIGFLLFFL